jgi:hypothetical protein
MDDASNCNYCGVRLTVWNRVLEGDGNRCAKCFKKYGLHSVQAVATAQRRLEESIRQQQEAKEREMAAFAKECERPAANIFESLWRTYRRVNVIQKCLLAYCFSAVSLAIVSLIAWSSFLLVRPIWRLIFPVLDNEVGPRAPSPLAYFLEGWWDTAMIPLGLVVCVLAMSLRPKVGRGGRPVYDDLAAWPSYVVAFSLFATMFGIALVFLVMVGR